MRSKDVYIIKHIGGLTRLKEILEEYQVYDTNNENVFLLYGYKTMHDGAKQTYKALAHLKTSLKQNPVKVSLDLLATILGTSEEAQSARLKELTRHNLIRIIKRPYELNQYEILELLPDFTFAETIYKLIRRRMMSDQLHQLKKSLNPIEKISIYENVKNLQNLGASHPEAESVIKVLLE